MNEKADKEEMIIDAHLHINRFTEKPGPENDFYHPPKMKFVVDEILEHMDREEVERAVIMQHPDVPFNGQVIEAVRKYPERFAGSMILPLDAEDVLEQMEENRRMGLRILKFEMSETMVLYPDLKFDSVLMQKIFERAEKLDMAVAIDPFRIDTSGYQPRELAWVIPKFPDLRFVICHLGFPMADTMNAEENLKKWRAMIALAENKNVWMDFSAMPDMFADIDAYPYPKAAEMLRRFLDEYGAEKAMWGSDIPGMLKRGTYGDLINMYREGSLFSEEEKRKIFYENALSVYFGK